MPPDPTVIKLRDFTETPGPATREQGRHSAEEWAEGAFEPLAYADFERGIRIDLSGAATNIPVPFLREALSLLALRAGRVSPVGGVLLKKIKVVCPDEPAIEAEAHHLLRTWAEHGIFTWKAYSDALDDAELRILADIRRARPSGPSRVDTGRIFFPKGPAAHRVPRPTKVAPLGLLLDVLYEGETLVPDVQDKHVGILKDAVGLARRSGFRAHGLVLERGSVAATFRPSRNTKIPRIRYAFMSPSPDWSAECPTTGNEIGAKTPLGLVAKMRDIAVLGGETEAAKMLVKHIKNYEWRY